MPAQPIPAVHAGTRFLSRISNRCHAVENVHIIGQNETPSLLAELPYLRTSPAPGRSSPELAGPDLDRNVAEGWQISATATFLLSESHVTYPQETYRLQLQVFAFDQGGIPPELAFIHQAILNSQRDPVQGQVRLQGTTIEIFSNVEDGLDWLVFRLLPGLSHDGRRRAATVLLDRLLLPTFGSPPTSFEPLGVLLRSRVSAPGIVAAGVTKIVYESAPHSEPAMLFLTYLGVTTCLYVITPPLVKLGKLFENMVPEKPRRTSKGRATRGKGAAKKHQLPSQRDESDE